MCPRRGAVLALWGGGARRPVNKLPPPFFPAPPPTHTCVVPLKCAPPNFAGAMAVIATTAASPAQSLALHAAVPGVMADSSGSSGVSGESERCPAPPNHTSRREDFVSTPCMCVLRDLHNLLCLMCNVPTVLVRVFARGLAWAATLTARPSPRTGAAGTRARQVSLPPPPFAGGGGVCLHVRTRTQVFRAAHFACLHVDGCPRACVCDLQART
jgi:hypothetical protein